jgi:NDP-sugar pyrophosphorylase family protein
MKAVILAGGKGTRLHPYTTIFPKPLMPINQKPILELIFRQLHHHGFREINLAVGYLAELIKAFFNDGKNFNLSITYYREIKPLGTAGPLAMMKDDLQDSFLMMNGDILTKLNYSDFIRYHRKNKGIASVALTKRIVDIDYGVPKIDANNTILGYSEKPKIEYLVSMGVYAFEPEVLDYISPDEYLDFPNLITILIEASEVVKGYIYDGYWLDIGRQEDFERANREVLQIFPELFGDIDGL